MSLIVSTHENGLYDNGQLVSAPRLDVPRLTDLDRACAIGQLQDGVPQNQVAPLYHLKGQVLHNGKCQRQALKLGFQEGLKKPVSSPR